MSASGGQIISTGERFLCFSLGSEDYAIPLLSVKEVIAVPEITPLPFSPPHFLGIMNLRGQVISVVDLRQKLGIKPKPGAETAVIICDLAQICLGVVVDSINSVLSPEPENVSEKPEAQGSKASEFITGVYRKNEQLIVFLSIAKTLSLEDQKTIGTASKAKAA